MSTIEARVAGPEEIAEGEMLRVEVGSTDVLLLRNAGKLVALGAECPHAGAPLHEGSLINGRVICPWHCSVFDAESGDRLEPPALAHLPKFNVRETEQDVFVTVPADAETSRPLVTCDCCDDTDQRVFAIIGSGAAALAAAETLREQEFAGRILMISGEGKLPYDRTLASKSYLAGSSDDEDMSLHDEHFYTRHKIHRCQHWVEDLNVSTRTIRLDNGETMTPDAILVATGGTPRPLVAPGGKLPGVMTLRSWDDSRQIRNAAKNAKNIVIVGAGFIGMEAAASLTEMDAKITIVAPEEIPLARALGHQIGNALRHLHEQHGTCFKLGNHVAAIQGDDHVTGVELGSGEVLPADLVIVGLGISPATRFLRNVGINDDASVSVDHHLELANQVFAAGDVARYPEPYSGQEARIEHWRHAQQQGRAAALNMLGAREPYRGVPKFWTRQFDVSLSYVGYVDRWDDVIIVGDVEKFEFTALYERHGKLLAAAGTQSDQIATFMELMRLGRVPSASLMKRSYPSARELQTV